MNTCPEGCAFRRTMSPIAIHRLFFLIVTVTASTVSALAQDIQKLDPALEQLVGPDSKLERIATGFNKWTEGPVWTHEGTLLFAEIPATTSTCGSRVGARAFSCTPADIQGQSHSTGRSQAQME
jgi:hypothetical protein